MPQEVSSGDAVPRIEDIRRAAERIRPHVHRTPVFTSNTVNEISGAEVFFKCENLQKAGAFKVRGATNAVFSLSKEQARRGVATHSSGNHAAALALAGGRRDIPVTVVMPENAPAIKKRAVEGYGASIIYCEPTFQAREEMLAQVAERTGAVIVHPFDDPRVIAGQGTAALELFEQAGDIDTVIAPVGGGGLLSGTALAARSLLPAARVFGAEPRNVNDAWQSLKVRPDHAGHRENVDCRRTAGQAGEPHVSDHPGACRRNHHGRRRQRSSMQCGLCGSA